MTLRDLAWEAAVARMNPAQFSVSPYGGHTPAPNIHYQAQGPQWFPEGTTGYKPYPGAPYDVQEPGLERPVLDPVDFAAGAMTPKALQTLRRLGQGLTEPLPASALRSGRAGLVRNQRGGIGEKKTAPWEMTQDEFATWTFETPESGSRTPATVFKWKAGEDFESLADVAQGNDAYRFHEILGKGWESTTGIPNSLSLASKIRSGKPITVYRASDTGGIVPGSYVTESLQYAKRHGDVHIPGGKFTIDKLDVFPDELLVYGDPHEFLYVPRSVTLAHRRIIQKAIEQKKDIPKHIKSLYPDLFSIIEE